MIPSTPMVSYAPKMIPIYSQSLTTLKIPKLKFPTKLFLLNFRSLLYIKLTTWHLNWKSRKALQLNMSKTYLSIFPPNVFILLDFSNFLNSCSSSIRYKGGNIMIERAGWRVGLPLLSQPWGGDYLPAASQGTKAWLKAHVVATQLSSLPASDAPHSLTTAIP